MSVATLIYHYIAAMSATRIQTLLSKIYFPVERYKIRQTRCTTIHCVFCTVQHQMQSIHVSFGTVGTWFVLLMGYSYVPVCVNITVNDVKLVCITNYFKSEKNVVTSPDEDTCDTDAVQQPPKSICWKFIFNWSTGVATIYLYCLILIVMISCT